MLEFEGALPQHNPDLPFPEGRKGRYAVYSSLTRLVLDTCTLPSYIHFSGHAWGSGWNNVLQEQCVPPKSRPDRMKQGC